MNRSFTFSVPFILILIIAAAEMATAIYTPCLPLVAKHFNVSESLVQWTISINLLGLALSGPIYGPFSDCFGRRVILRVGMGLFLVGSFFSFVAYSIESLLLARFIQGLGAGVAVVVAFATVRDLFTEQKSAQVLSYMGMAIALSPGVAPILGSSLAHHFNWKMCFGVVSGVALMIFVLLFTWMPETLAKKERSAYSFTSIVRGYGRAFQNGRFLTLSLIPSLMIGGLWAWMATLPVLFISHLDVPLHDYGYYGFSGVAIYVMGTFINSRLVRRFPLRTLLARGLWMSLFSSVFLIVAGYLDFNSPVLLQILNFPFAFGLALILPNGTALAFSEVKEGRGTSSALLGSAEMAFGALGIFLMGILFQGTIIAIAGMMLGCGVMSLILFYSLPKREEAEVVISEIIH